MGIKEQAMALQKELGYDFDFHEDTQTFHCKKCGQVVGQKHPTEPGAYRFSLCVFGDEAHGICYDCFISK